MDVKNLNRDVDPFTKAYIICALWAETDGDKPLESNYNWTHIEEKTLQKMIEDCARFQKENEKDLCVSVSQNANEGGHCFWLSRNGHGSGFFDSEVFANDVRDRLDKNAEKFGQFWLHVFNGKIYH